MKPRPTPAEHAELGSALAALRDEVQRRHVQVAHAYPQSSPQAVQLKRALESLDSARSALDDALCREDPEGFDGKVYYPGADNRARVEFRTDGGSERVKDEA